jgi:hypothetical protein
MKTTDAHISHNLKSSQNIDEKLFTWLLLCRGDLKLKAHENKVLYSSALSTDLMFIIVTNIKLWTTLHERFLPTDVKQNSYRYKKQNRTLTTQGGDTNHEEGTIIKQLQSGTAHST